jgi:hypothetical protein
LLPATQTIDPFEIGILKISVGCHLPTDDNGLILIFSGCHAGPDHYAVVLWITTDDTMLEAVVAILVIAAVQAGGGDQDGGVGA